MIHNQHFNYDELKRVCIGQFEENSHLFNTTVKENIEKNRKGRKTVTLKDRAGNTKPGVPVRITLKNHEFKHGGHIFLLDQFESAEENRQYRDFFHKHFNLATVPFYWAGLEPEQGKVRFAADSPNVYRRPAPDLCLDYCREKGIAAKLHCLFYDKFIPGWLPKENADEMKKLYEKRFREIAERYAGGIMYDIEVINEILESPAWKTNSVLSRNDKCLDYAFALAEKYFPDDILVINDGNFVPEIGRKGKEHPYCKLIDGAIKRGLRIDKIGVQNHIYLGLFDDHTPSQFASYYDPVAILKGLDVLSELGKPLEITEVTIPTFGEGNEAEDMQAEVFKYLYTLWFSSEKIESVIYWNSIDNTAYSDPAWNENRLDAGILHRDLTEKKSAKMLRKLFREEWHTEIETQSDENGEISFNGFHGDYEIQIGEESYSLNLGKKAAEETVLI